MLILQGSIKVKAEKREEAIALFLETQEITQQEDGCLAYSFYADLKDPNTFIVYEKWQTKENLKAHGSAAHMLAFRDKFMPCAAGPSDIKVYEVSSETPLHKHKQENS